MALDRPKVNGGPSTITRPDSFIPTSEQQPFIQPAENNNFFTQLVETIKPVATGLLDFEASKQAIENEKNLTAAQVKSIEAKAPVGNQAPKNNFFTNPQNRGLLIGGGIAIALLLALTLMRK